MKVFYSVVIYNMHFLFYTFYNNNGQTVHYIYFVIVLPGYKATEPLMGHMQKNKFSHAHEKVSGEHKKVFGEHEKLFRTDLYLC